MFLSYNCIVKKQEENNVIKLKRLYYKEGLSMSDVAKALSVSIDSVVYLMRKHNLKRRDFKEANDLLPALRFATQRGFLDRHEDSS